MTIFFTKFPHRNQRRFEMAEYNRRNFPRENMVDTIQVLHIPDDFEGHEDRCESITGKIANQSDNGLYIEIDRELQPGSNVRIKLAFQEKNAFDEVDYIRDGQVIWCEKVDETTSHYGIGIKILRKTVQAHILTNRFR
jgi:hypothetical protein